MPTDKPRCTLNIDDELSEKIDDFRFENRYPSRSSAVMELIRMGLEASEKQKKNKSK